MEEAEGDETSGDTSKSIAEVGEQALSATCDGDMQKFGEWQVDGGVGETLAMGLVWRCMWNLGELDRRALRPRVIDGENQTDRVPSAPWERNLFIAPEGRRVVCLALVTPSSHA